MPIAKQLIHPEITLAIVKIFIYEEFQGTGFFISPHHLITAFHCIKNPPPSNIKIELTSAKKIVVQWVAEKSLTELDIAVLQIVSDYQSPHYLPLGLITKEHLAVELNNCLNQNLQNLRIFRIKKIKGYRIYLINFSVKNLLRLTSIVKFLKF